jgi:integrase/recombinase XerD
VRTDQAISEFLSSRLAANLSRSTIEWYKDRLLPLVHSSPTLPRRPEPIETYLAALQGSPETKYDVYRALKTFFRFMSSRRHLPNPMEQVGAPRRPRTLMPTLEVTELTKLLSATHRLHDKAIITLFVDCGIRSGELSSLLKHNIKEGTIIVHGKVGWREVPISAETKQILLQVAASSPNDYVFPGQKGPISRHTIYGIIRGAFERSGIKGPKLGPHRLRHAFGKNFLVSGGDLRSLQEIMGHIDIETTQKYASLNLNDIVKKHQQFSPLKAAHAAEEILKEAEEILNGTKKEHL